MRNKTQQASDRADGTPDRGSISGKTDAADQPVHPETKTPPSAAASTDGPCRAGLHLGRYVLREKIGEGGMGQVWLAEREDELHLKVAVKLLKPGFWDTKGKRFLQERQLLTELHHPYIAKVLDGGTNDAGFPWLAMEYIEGFDLKTHCENHRLTVDQRLQLFIKVCQAVIEAHRSFVLHRDLKPSNILVTREGHPKLLDFGIAAMLDEETGMQKTLTRVHEGLMTPEYASPEHIQGKRLTTASDVYSLGVVLYELICGVTPYDLQKKSPLEMLRIVCEEEIPRPTVRLKIYSGTTTGGSPDTAERLSIEELTLRRGTTLKGLRNQLKSDLETIMLKALAKDPNRRYPSVRHLAEDLECYLAGKPVSARPATMWYRAQKFAKRRPWPLTVAVLLLVFVAAFTANNHIQAAKAQAERDRALMEQRTAREVSEFLVSLFHLSKPEHGRNDSITALELLENGKRKIDRELTGQPLIRARLMRTLGQVYRSMGVYETAAKLTADARRELERSAAPPEDLFGTNLDMAEVYLELGQVEKASRLWQRISQAPPKDLPASELLHFAARLAHLQGNNQEALVKFHMALAAEPEPTHRRGRIRMDLADLHKDLGEFDEADAIYQSLFAGYANDQTKLADIAMKRAGVMVATGRYDRAVPLLDQALAMLRKVYGETHPKIGNTLLQAADMHIARADREAAVAAANAALDQFRATFGENHPDVAHALARIAVLHINMRDLATAERRYREALLILESAFGREHEQYAIGLVNMGFLYHEKFDPENALLKFTQAHAIFEKTWGAEHHKTALSLSEIARIRIESNKLDGVEPMIVQAVETLERRLGQDHTHTLNAYRYYAHFLTKTKRLEEAELLLRKTLNSKVKTLGEDNAEVADARYYLGRVLLRAQKLKQAKHQFALCLAFDLKFHGPNSDLTAASLKLSGTVNLALGAAEKAGSYLTRATDIFCSFYGPKHEQTLAAMQDLIKALAWHKDYAAAHYYADTLYRATAETQPKKAKARFLPALTLAEVLSRQQRPEAAWPYLQDAAALLDGEEQPSTPDHLAYQMVHGLMLAGFGAVEEAESEWQCALQTAQNELGRRHPTTKKLLKLLADFYQSRGDLTRYADYQTQLSASYEPPETNTAEGS